jgi:fucose permease
MGRIIGASSGMLTSAAFHIITPLYHHDPAATVNVAGVTFGLGCLTMALLIAGTYYVYTVPSILVLAALIPGFLAGAYARMQFPARPEEPEPPFRQVWRDFRSPGAVLFSLILFFQFGNEWSVAGWLPIFLIQRIGVSPAASLQMLAFFWLALLVGRGAAQWLLPRVRHGKLLMGSVTAAMLGSIVLLATNNRFGAATGILFIGGGFAMIYPLVVERIGHRFPYYRPGFYNSLFSFAITGGFLAPWTLGFCADLWEIQIVMALPLIGTTLVFVLLVLLWVETRLTTAAR